MKPDIQNLAEEMRKLQVQLEEIKVQRQQDNTYDEEMEDLEDWEEDRGWEAVMPPTMIAARTAPALKLWTPWTKASAGFPTFLHPTKG